MIEEQTPGGVTDPETGPRMSAGGTFSQWLQVQLKARRLTQRQLAQKSGVDHTTISRLVRGERTPSLRTVSLLARGLGMPQGLGRLDGLRLDKTDSPAARVEYALRSDELLSDPQVRRIMLAYLDARLRHTSSVAAPAPMQPTGRARPPIIVQVAGVRPASTPIARPPMLARGRSR